MVQFKAHPIVAVSGTKRVSRQDDLAVEEPLEIRVETRSISVTMRTPGHDDELAAGFLVTEGLIRKRGDIAEIKTYPRNEAGNVVDVFLGAGVQVDFQRLTRHVFASSSCGLCGKASIEAVHQHFKPVKGRSGVKGETLARLPAILASHQKTFARNGGLHA